MSQLQPLSSDHRKTVLMVSGSLKSSISVSATTKPSYSSSVVAPTDHTRRLETQAESALTSRDVEKVDVLVAGSLAIDFSCDFAPFGSRKAEVTPAAYTSNPAVIEQSLGGVGYNVAIASNYIGGKTLFCSAVAHDLSGRAALAAIEREGLSTTGIQSLSPSLGVRTAQYVAVNDVKKDLFVAMADMAIMELSEHALDVEEFWGPLLTQTQPKWVVVDGNWNPAVIDTWIKLGKQAGARIAFEPVSTAKATRPFTNFGDKKSFVIGPSDTVPKQKIDLAAPNELELTSIYSNARENGLFDSAEWWNIINDLNFSSAGSRDLLASITSQSLVDTGIPQQSIQLLPFIPSLVIKLGRQGVLVTELLPRGDVRLTSPDSARYILSRAAESEAGNEMVGGVYMRLFPPETVLSDEEVVSVNGAGDTLLGVVVAGLAKEDKPRNIEDVIQLAQRASLHTLQSRGGVSSKIRELQTLL